MIEWIKLKLSLKIDFFSDKKYEKCVCDVIHHEMVVSMKNYIQHGNTNCLEHSLYVSYISYMICRRLGLDYRSAARGGLLHDFFLYDWHMRRPQKGLHGFIHPNIALKNANKYFNLNDNEKDIIQKHMWPLTITLPRYKESFVVLFTDKYCAFMETVGLFEK
ncbi:HD family phosphohydrolase [Clostridium carboxidivorans P7]|uniref:Metal dependent phophohydrolase n=1 Tax=Clostridium carboxidivorans P7 TaxID=536227 RepID=C6Q1C8_9CLOT|nr:HDIG domain-containing metalloprotein [Clostridium carboxidivorans]AKN31522.1 HD family phosphohydrolase [Clostridium carboxidivorans P7]EET84710.1 metal dependent phophohydrolase [Clostridium carboxidivorans P7]EFG87075.1 uncharacterized domain HDIG containing protein [Clostridium carboxidivorans P7]